MKNYEKTNECEMCPGCLGLLGSQAATLVDIQ